MTKFMKISIAIWLMFMLLSSTAQAKNHVHPRNIKLVNMGLMPKIPKYHPEIPRIMPYTALRLYNANKALFVLISYHDRDLIYGGIHLTEGEVPKVNPKALPVKKGQILVLY